MSLYKKYIDHRTFTMHGLAVAVLVFLCLGFALPTRTIALAQQPVQVAVIPGTTGGGNGAATPVNTPTCPANNSFFGLEPWYEYVKDHFSTNQSGVCSFNMNFTIACGDADSTSNDQPITSYTSNGTVTKCTQNQINNHTVIAIDQGNLGVFWLIGLAIFDDLLRIAGIIAFGFVLYGGIRYITSQGEPENTRAALGTIINALIGMAIAIIAAVLVSFLANAL